MMQKFLTLVQLIIVASFVLCPVVITLWAWFNGAFKEGSLFKQEVEALGELEAKKAFAASQARKLSGENADAIVADMLASRKAKQRSARRNDDQPDLGDECDELVGSVISEG